MDSVIFVLVAFAGTMPTEVLVSILVANILVKGVTTLVSLPLIYAVPESDQSPLFARKVTPDN